MTEQGGDRLRAVNDALRADPVAMAAQSSAWLPLESNPSVLNAYSRRVGLHDGWTWVDVWGLDEDLLETQGLLGEASKDRPVAALVLLFPCSRRIYDHRAREERSLRENTDVAATAARGGSDNIFPRINEEAFFVEQVAGFGNACGTIAATHALANCFQPFESEEESGPGETHGETSSKKSKTSDTDRDNDTRGTEVAAGPTPGGLIDDAPLSRFVSAHAGRSPREIGRALLTTDDLRSSSDAAASSEEAQTALPSRDADPLDHHFVAFVRRRRGKGQKSGDDVGENDAEDDVLVELDGTKAGAVEHRATSRASFVRDAVEVVRRNWVEVDPDNVEFALMALCWVPEGGRS